MADLTETENNIIRIEGPTGNDLVVNPDGSINVDGLSVGVDIPTANTIAKYVEEGKVFSISTTQNMDSAGTDNPLVYIKNPSASGKVLYLYRVVLGLKVENNYGLFKIFKNPTVTADGTSLTKTNRNIGDSNTSSMEAYYLPTVTSNGTEILSYINAANANSVEILKDFSIFVQAGNSVLITGDPKSNGRPAVITAVWAEV